MNVVEGTVKLTRTYARPVEALFSAWTREESQRAWGDPDGSCNLTFDQFRFAVDEADICRFGPDGGAEYLNVNHYLAIEPDQRIVYTMSLSREGKLTFAGAVLALFERLGDGSRIRLVEQGLYFDSGDSVEAHRASWEGMLSALGSYLDGQPR